jgi:hypothetical protein
VYEIKQRLAGACLGGESDQIPVSNGVTSRGLNLLGGAVSGKKNSCC